jgi:hypothetical protein
VRNVPWTLGSRDLEGFAQRSSFERCNAIAIIVLDLVDQLRMSPISAIG